jgi:hypothetical protein
VRFVQLDTLFRQSDVVSLHCPLTPQTAKLVYAHRLSLLNSPKAQLHLPADSSLIPSRMAYWIRMIVSSWRRWFKSPKASVDRSQLVGMYLSQANKPLDSTARSSGTRERQEGKFSQNRRRG